MTDTFPIDGNDAPSNRDDLPRLARDDSPLSARDAPDSSRLRTSPRRTTELAAAVVEREAGDECTIYPRDADEESLVTEWITAKEGSYVGLDEMR